MVAAAIGAPIPGLCRSLASSISANSGQPMNGAVWISSPRWPFGREDGAQRFHGRANRRLHHLPGTDIAWANPALRPEQGAISGGNAAIDGTLTGTGATGNAIALSNRRTDTALSLAGTPCGQRRIQDAAKHRKCPRKDLSQRSQSAWTRGETD